MTARPLDGMRVVEWCSLVCGPFCGKWLAEAGADVIKIEAPGEGDEARRRGPFPDDQPDPERSGLYLLLNTNKRGITLNPETADGLAILRDLIARADVFLHDRPPALADELGLDYETLSAQHEQLVVTSITPYGYSGPRRDEHAYPLNVVHASGATYHQLAGQIALRDFPDAGPVKPGSFIAECDAGLNAATATLAALLARMGTGRGQHVDVSKQWAMMSTQRPEVHRYASDGTIVTRELDTEWFPGVYQCKDGWVVFGAVWGERNWAAAVEMMGHPWFASEPWFTEELWNLPQLGIPKPDHADEVRDTIAEWCMERTREQIQDTGQAHGLTITGHVDHGGGARQRADARARLHPRDRAPRDRPDPRHRLPVPHLDDRIAPAGPRAPPRRAQPRGLLRPARPRAGAAPDPPPGRRYLVTYA